MPQSVDDDYVGKVYNPETDLCCQSCPLRAPGFCPCTIVEIIEVSDEEVERIKAHLDKGARC